MMPPIIIDMKDELTWKASDCNFESGLVSGPTTKLTFLSVTLLVLLLLDGFIYRDLFK